MIVAQLIEILKHYPQGHTVVVSWEGVDSHLDDSNIYIKNDMYSDLIVTIDGDDNFYKGNSISLTQDIATNEPHL